MGRSWSITLRLWNTSKFFLGTAQEMRNLK